MAQKTFVVAGVESLRERGDSFYHSDSSYGPYNEDFVGKQARTYGFFGDVRTTVADGLSVDIGARADDNQRFSRRMTWRFAPQYKIEATGTRLKSMIGTGYKAPSLYEIFSMYGSRDLNPERSLGWDFGVEQEFGKGSVVLGATYFHHRFKNLISFDPGTYLFKNISAARTAGVELTGAFRLTDGASVNLSYTYTDPTDTVTDQRLLRRTRNRASLFSSYRWCDIYTSSVGYTWIGSRLDNDYSQAIAAKTSLGGYGLLHIGGTARVDKGIQVEARIENALDKRYQEIFGYGTPGLAAYGGVRFTY
jgi:vitamin B12 transporter